LDWLALSVFIEIAAGRSLAKAARQLKIAPMSATRRLSALEKELGVRLVNRTTRAISLTSEGQSFLPHARALLDERSAAYASIKHADKGAFGLLRVTTSVAFGRIVAAPLIVRFMRDNPSVKVDLIMTDDLVDIVKEGVDLAVRIANLSDSSLTARRLADSPRLLLAAPEYLARYGIPRNLEDLAKHDCLPISGTTHWSFKAGGQVRQMRVDGRFTANSIEGLLQASLCGLGIANLSSWYVQEEVRKGSLQQIELEDATPEELGVWALYPTKRHLPPKTKLFIDALAARVRDWPLTKNRRTY
jgi:DNA-binding transcriptional LysR family regulator